MFWIPIFIAAYMIDNAISNASMTQEQKEEEAICKQRRFESEEKKKILLKQMKEQTKKEKTERKANAQRWTDLV